MRSKQLDVLKYVVEWIGMDPDDANGRLVLKKKVASKKEEAAVDAPRYLSSGTDQTAVFLAEELKSKGLRRI